TASPSFIESTQTPHIRAITLTNPWQRTLNGQMTILGPQNWRIEPSQVPLSIPPGESITLPIQIIFPISEVAGPKELLARFDFTADRHYRFDGTAPLMLGLKEVQLDGSLSWVS